MPKVGVVLSGCGFLDGAEIHESVCTLLALDQAGAEVLCCAPNVPQADVVDYLTQKPSGERRNVLSESARIARCAIQDVAAVKPGQIDALIFPGGYGAAKNLCTFATDGVECRVNPDVERLINGMLDAHKPVGFICIAPALAARVLQKRGVKGKLTIGNDKQTAAAISQMAGEHADCVTTACVTDEKNKIVSTPAYMLGPGPAAVYEGIRKLVSEVLRLAKK
jgi:enhancing lycopene biosynthesis protein 2